ncbi:TetR/AcrR family transcriptional regulator [Candidatus Cryosericum septentrionale]|jgi:AcrR family transcriptional regulator|uniref:TetR/AcrR family transcriptional regulator n=1 Tax=Candidatus Cryosericum septentrionale TaxID=2290913 RepID=A0A398DTY7_9BACT|nr:TetR/AcrR family transcriptional regulator [Candidatus Cryosericum septentrionale]RIE17589.1 TetR/AcrR family transcriptional regulator [Candidatus Cryosericum septentrionale]
MAPRSEESNTQIKDDRQKQILSSALKVFIHKGFAAAKMSDIATEAGISYGLMYHYFQSKDEIYAELVRDAVDSSRHMIEQLKADDMEPIDKMRALVAGIFKSVGQEQSAGYYFVLMMEAMTSGVYPVQAIEHRHGPGRSFEMLVRVIEQGQHKGQIAQGDPAQLVYTFFSAILGLASLKVSGTIETMPDPEILMRIFQPASQTTTRH